MVARAAARFEEQGEVSSYDGMPGIRAGDMWPGLHTGAADTRSRADRRRRTVHNCGEIRPLDLTRGGKSGRIGVLRHLTYGNESFCIFGNRI